MSWLECLLFILAVILLYLLIRKPHNYPPGPILLPIIGNIFSLALTTGTTPHEKAWNLGKKYGPITGLYLGPRPTVIITGYKAVKHVLSREDLASRPNAIFVTARFFQRRLGVIFNDGPVWREQRRFSLRHLRDFGFGRRSMETLIHEETRALIEGITKASMEPNIDLLPILPVHAINILWTIMAGKRQEVDDENFIQLTQAVMKFFRNGNILNFANGYPKLQKLPIIRRSFDKQLSAIRQIQDFLEATIDNHLKTYDENHMRDFIDVYIQEMKQSGENSSFSISELCMICMDLFIAGTETTSGTLSYAMRYMLQYPHIQQKLREEILREIGSERLPSMEDVGKLHYVQAVVNEVLRHSGLVPFTLPHATHKTVEVLGYKVPKGSTILPNLWSVHMDPEIWGDPENFRPERFINSSGEFSKNEHSLFFGFGPRMCLGEPLARYSTFMIFTALVQNFEFTPPAGTPPPSSEQLQGLTTSPAPYLVAVKLA